MTARALINVGWQGGIYDYPYINFFKLYQSEQAGTYAYPGVLDTNGYPTSAPASSISGTILLPVNYSGHWVLKWTGTGRLRLDRGSPGFTVISDVGSAVQGSTAFNLDVSGTNVRVVFDFTTSAASSVATNLLSTGTFSGMGNLVLCRIADEAALAGGEIFNPDFVAFHAALGSPVVRVMDLPNTNACNLSRHAYRHSTSAISFINPRWDPKAWVGVLSGTDTYTCAAATDTPGSWTDGEVIQFQVANANTGTAPTLNVGSRGAKTIKTDGAQTFSIGGLAVNGLYTGVYDATVDAVLVHSGGISTKAPLEVLVALANKLNKDLWLCLPHQMDNASYTAIATYIKANLNSNLTVYPELSNETWNSSFAQFFLYAVQGQSLGFTNANSRREFGSFAKRHCEVMGLFSTVWAGATSPALKRVLAFQAFGDTGNTETYRFKGTDLGAYGFDTAPNRPIDRCDVMSYATYFSGDNAKNFDSNYTGGLTTLLAAADNYNSAVPANMESALDWLDADLRGASTSNETLKALNDVIYPAWQTLAATYGKQVVPYEGGLEIAAPSTSRLTALSIDTGYSAKIQALYDAYKGDGRFKVLVSTQFRQIKAQANTRYPGWYMSIGASQWSLTSGDLYSTKWTSWDGIVGYNAGKSSFRVKWAS